MEQSICRDNNEDYSKTDERNQVIGSSITIVKRTNVNKPMQSILKLMVTKGEKSLKSS